MTHPSIFKLNPLTLEPRHPWILVTQKGVLTVWINSQTFPFVPVKLKDTYSEVLFSRLVEFCGATAWEGEP
jgi:hypothetical protein